MKKKNYWLRFLSVVITFMGFASCSHKTEVTKPDPKFQKEINNEMRLMYGVPPVDYTPVTE